jgi:hypothetical protein
MRGFFVPAISKAPVAARLAGGAVCQAMHLWLIHRSRRQAVLLRGGGVLLDAEKTKPQPLTRLGSWNLILTMTYSHMGKPHTTIGDTPFHF